jgi:hypothetical protein
VDERFARLDMTSPTINRTSPRNPISPDTTIVPNTPNIGCITSNTSSTVSTRPTVNVSRREDGSPVAVQLTS